VDARMWSADRFISTRFGNRVGSALMAGESIGRLPGRRSGQITSWKLYAAGQTTPGWPNGDEGGFVFIDGRYVEPPYSVEVLNGAIIINGTIVRAPPYQATVIPPPPSNPTTAADLAEVAAARFRERGGVASPEMTQELMALLRSFPAAAEVIDAGDQIIIVDR